MTLDEAIQHAEELADYDCYNENQFKCAAEYSQLAEWLNELKRLREERKRGKWIKKIKKIKLNGAIAYEPSWICPECGTIYDGSFAFNFVKYCYCCGIDLRTEGAQES